MVGYVGEVYPTKKHGDVEIVEYNKAADVTVKFLKTGYLKKVQMSHVLAGNMLDNTQPTTLGVGIRGTLPTCNENGVDLKEYTAWYNMLKRCYPTKNSEHLYLSYQDCYVSEYFKHYENFNKWWFEQVGYNENKWCLDKDILIKGNKMYSEDNCCIVPQQINALFTKANRIRGGCPVGVSFNKSIRKFEAYFTQDNLRVRLGYYTTPEEAFLSYKVAKETHIKQVANKWKGKIDNRVYEALLKYEVSIDD